MYTLKFLCRGTFGQASLYMLITLITLQLNGLEIYPKCTRVELITHPKKLQNEDDVSPTQYSGTNEIK